MTPLFRCATLALFIFASSCAQPVKPAPQAAAQANPVPAPTAIVPVAAATVVAPVAALAADPVMAPSAEKIDAFIAETAKSSGMPAEQIRSWLGQARYQQSIINAITRPAEGKPWRDYRPIFLTETRISQGRSFYAEHRGEIDKVSRDTGVPGEIIVAIIGVETSYGRITGSYRVLDALYTLAFYYPRREEFFRSELANLFALAREERLDLATLKGSYAGAMGFGQFMPSSYRNYAKDGDGDGRRDLLGSTRDAFASVANYFVGYGWHSGEPVFLPATADAGAAPFKPDDFVAKYTLPDLAARGYRPVDTFAPKLPVTLLTLEGAQGTEHWIGYHNFFVITRYNRSPMYAMAVFQLSQEIAAGQGASP